MTGRSLTRRAPFGAVVVALLAGATLFSLLPVSFTLAHFGDEMASGNTRRIALAALALGLLTGVPLALRWIARRRRGR